MQFILQKGAPINNLMYQDRLDCYVLQEAFGLGTPLHEAASLGKVATARLLLQNGADPWAKDSPGRTAYQRAKENQHDAIAEYLLDVMSNAKPT